MLGIASNQVAPTAALAVVCVAAIALLYRPLMLSSVLAEVGEARGVSSFRMELCFLAVVALASTMTVPVVGTLLIFSLMIGAPAAARSLTDRPLVAMALSVAIALIIVWSAIARRMRPTTRSGSSSALRRRRRTRSGAAGRPTIGDMTARRFTGVGATQAELALATASGRKRGGARRALLELLAGQECALTALEIEDALRARSARPVSRASVYRILDELEALGARASAWRPARRWSATSACASTSSHHHHLVCDQCGW